MSENEQNSGNGEIVLKGQLSEYSGRGIKNIIDCASENLILSDRKDIKNIITQLEVVEGFVSEIRVNPDNRYSAKIELIYTLIGYILGTLKTMLRNEKNPNLNRLLPDKGFGVKVDRTISDIKVQLKPDDVDKKVGLDRDFSAKSCSDGGNKNPLL